MKTEKLSKMLTQFTCSFMSHVFILSVVILSLNEAAKKGLVLYLFWYLFAAVFWIGVCEIKEKKE